MVFIIAVVQYQNNRENIRIKLVTGYLEYCYSIYRTIAGEFDPYDLLLKLSYEPSLLKNRQKFQLYIESVVHRYNSYKNFDYMTAVGYCSYPEINHCQEYNSKSKVWEINSIAALHIRKQSRILSEKELYDFHSYIHTSNDLVFTIFKLDKEIPLIITVTFDVSLFYNNLIIPVLEEVYPHFDIELVQPNNLIQPITESGNFFPDLEFKFSILKHIFPNNNKERWLIPLPKEIFNLSGLEKSDDQNKDSLYKYIKHYLNNVFTPDDMFGFLDIRKNNKSVLLHLEKELVITWIMQLILLLGIGTAFVLLLLQLVRMEQLRLKEKEFVASVTHELKTPLTVIKSVAENLKRGIIPAERRESYGGFLMEQTQRLITLVEEILLFSRIENRTHPQSLITVVDLHEIVQQIVDELKGLSPDITITLDIRSLPHKAAIDRESFEMIMRNIIINAQIHAYPDDQNGIIRVTGWLKIPDKLVFTIEDTGIGIPGSEQRSIFRPFYRCRITKGKQVKGSGLGLFLAFKKARLMNGHLKVTSPYERKNGEKVSGCLFMLQVPYMPLDEKGESE